jgi:hypothetical protein
VGGAVTAPSTNPSGTRALNAAQEAGFEVQRHGAAHSYYWHELRDGAGRTLTLRSELETGRFLHAAASWPIVGGQYKTNVLRRLRAALYALTQTDRPPAFAAPEPEHRPMPTHEIGVYVRLAFEGVNPGDAWNRVRDALGLWEGYELTSELPETRGGTRHGTVTHVAVLHTTQGDLPEEGTLSE